VTEERKAFWGGRNTDAERNTEKGNKGEKDGSTEQKILRRGKDKASSSTSVKKKGEGAAKDI